MTKKLIATTGRLFKNNQFNDHKPLELPCSHDESYRPTGQDYGDKLPTPYKVKHNNRTKRIYATSYGNASSLWINALGGRLMIEAII